MELKSKQRFMEAIGTLNPIEDAVFRKMAESIEFCEEILRVFLQEPKLRVVSNHSQHSVTSIEGRSVILDAYCELEDGRKVNVEVQNANNTDHQRRVRYYGSVLTTSLMKKGDSFDKVPNICIVYVCNFDIFGLNKSLYVIKRIIDKTEVELDNGLQEIYISPVNDGSLIAELMRVFTESDVYNLKFPVTSEMKLRFNRETKGEKMTEALRGVYEALREEVDRESMKAAMREGMERGIEEGRARGIEEGIAKGVLSSLVSLVKDGLISVSEAAKRADMSEEDFKKYLE
ncbi:Rpn family recombination-promoting nuclease/putative transposase [Lachnoanaerobaculum orale]|uniref:Rpn family recombination-promoting nuclease/putative transposase n=1 Tax=Lachnoanaerobaculum orale TaxID=979627 RepID=A0A3P3Q9E9_9FIRM|nr:Rpn family recombination-promoting nuclease/putative transposase [Lachnoanaerobaculum orale]RRJ16960.1 Rpn family recombination-promoting nuclease/putative transposase [Lachnoanaerobaculum orale]